MKTLLQIIFLMLMLPIYSQIVASDCTAPDSIIDSYKGSAAQLALRRIYENNYSAVDSINIPQLSRDTTMNALIAVYNATSLPARDTVISLDIYASSVVSTSAYLIQADTNLFWMQELHNGNINTGHVALDNFNSTYNFSIAYFGNSPSNPIATVYFLADDHFNMPKLMDVASLDTIQGVELATEVGWVINYWTGKEITSEVYPTYVELNYTTGWGDCPAGCMEFRTWTFHVFYDCSVEYIGSSGDPFVEEPELSLNVEKHLVSIVDLMGRPSEIKPNVLLIYQYSDGSSVKMFKVD